MKREKAEALVQKLTPTIRQFAKDVIVAGSYRRGKTEIGDLDFIVVNGEIEKIVEAVKPTEVIRQGFLLATVIVDGEQVEFSRAHEDSIGAAMLHGTGSGKFNEGMRAYAKRMGMKLNQYGLWQGSERLAAKTEEEIFQALGLEFVAPEGREWFGHISVGRADKDIPQNVKIAKVLFAVAKAYDESGDKWRAKSFKTAAVSVKAWPIPMSKMHNLLELPGVGPSLAAEIEVIRETGTSTRL